MSGCAELRPLLEKVHDLEATAAEKLAAEAHLERCAGCRGHLAFLQSLSEESRSMSYPEPPDSYWEHLPGKVLRRIDSEGARSSGFLARLLTPPVMRWGALAAALVVIGAVGLSVLREEASAPAPPPASASLPEAATPPPALEEAPAPEVPVTAQAAPERRSQPTEAPSAPPPMARDETAESETVPESEVAGFAVDSAAPGELVAASPSIDERVAPAEEAERERALALRANRADSAPKAMTLGRSETVDDCEALRRDADNAPEGRERADARYGLALCSLGKHELESTEELERLAVKDAEGFLALETEGPRAEQVRALLRRIKPD